MNAVGLTVGITYDFVATHGLVVLALVELLLDFGLDELLAKAGIALSFLVGHCPAVSNIYK